MLSTRCVVMTLTKMKAVNEYRHGNAIIYVYRPELTEEERAKRERNLLSALEQYGKAVYQQKGEV